MRRWLAFFLLFSMPARAQQQRELLLRLIGGDRMNSMRGERWPDFSAEGLRNQQEADRATLAQLHTIERMRLNAEERTAYDVLEWRLEREIEEFGLGLYVTPFWGDGRYMQLPLPATASGVFQRSEEKLATFPAYVSQVTALLREGMRRRMLPSRQLVSVLDGACSHLNAAKDAPTEARQAAERFCEFLEKEYVPACPESRSLKDWPNGAEVYRAMAHRATTTDLDPQQLHEFGLKEVERIRADMLPVIARAGFHGTLDEFLEYARTDPRFYFNSSNDLRNAYTEAMRRIEPLVAKVARYIPREHVKVEAYDGGPLAMWSAARPGQPEPVVRVATNLPEIRAKFEIIPVLLHEGTPGHDLQHAVEYAVEARGKSDPIATYLSVAGQNPAFGEGWGLYAEGLGREMGLYRDPMDEFGELRMELTRAVRVVVDSGIHGQGWSVERAREYFLKQTGRAEKDVDEEIQRTLWPAGQLAYKVGQSRIQSLREETERALGERFDLRRFDDAMLRWGPLPLDALKRRLEECLAGECAAKLQATTPTSAP